MFVEFSLSNEHNYLIESFEFKVISESLREIYLFIKFA